MVTEAFLKARGPMKTVQCFLTGFVVLGFVSSIYAKGGSSGGGRGGRGGAHASGGHSSAPVPVNGYVRSNGTHVSPHLRTPADHTTANNWSTVGNSNPYTGQPGTKHAIPSGGSPLLGAQMPASPSNATGPANSSHESLTPSGGPAIDRSGWVGVAAVWAAFALLASGLLFSAVFSWMRQGADQPRNTGEARSELKPPPSKIVPEPVVSWKELPKAVANEGPNPSGHEGPKDLGSEGRALGNRAPVPGNQAPKAPGLAPDGKPFSYEKNGYWYNWLPGNGYRSRGRKVEGRKPLIPNSESMAPDGKPFEYVKEGYCYNWFPGNGKRNRGRKV